MTKIQARPQFDSLQQIYADVIGNARNDPLERIFAMTYEFDDQQLVNLIAARSLTEEFELRRNYLRFVAELQPVVIYDARKTREFTQIPHFLELIPVRAKPFSCHHSKAYLFMTEKSVRLAIGSFNLTYTGLFSNREVFMDFTWRQAETEDIAVLRAFVRLLREGYADHGQAVDSPGLQSLVQGLESRLAAWGDTEAPSGYALLPSGYPYESGENGLATLQTEWRKISANPPARVFAVSPFFDTGSTYLADALAKVLGDLKELHIATEESIATGLSKRHFGAARVCRLSLLGSLADDEEKRRIASANDGAQLGDLQLRRKLHAKILVLCGEEGRHLVYIGSANFTVKAWNGDNRELGLLRIEQGNADMLISRILGALSMTIPDAFAGLPELPTSEVGQDDEGYCAVPGYPDFLDRIELRQAEATDCLQFRFFTSEPARLSGYVIRWGLHELEVRDGVSQVLPPEQFMDRLLGGKNLAFSLREHLDLRFVLPFYHAADLVRHQDIALFPDAEDWLLHYAYPGRTIGEGSGEALPGEASGEPVAAMPALNRDANVVIAMQRYLSLFGAMEKEFMRRAQEVAALAVWEERNAACVRRIEQPLRTFAGILQRQKPASGDGARDAVYCFRLGELALFCRSLADTLPTLHPFATELVTLLRKRAAASDASTRTYASFCTERV